jgi:hypothetical protein
MTGPNVQANAGRKRAVSNMIDAAEELLGSGAAADGCGQLAAARSKVEAWFAGETAASLIARIDALRAAHGCP